MAELEWVIGEKSYETLRRDVFSGDKRTRAAVGFVAEDAKELSKAAEWFEWRPASIRFGSGQKWIRIV